MTWDNNHQEESSSANARVTIQFSFGLWSLGGSGSTPGEYAKLDN